MRCLWLFGLGAALIFPSAVFASEEADPFLFGGDVNYEEFSGFGAEEATEMPSEPEMSMPVKDFAPPPSDAALAHDNPLPMLQQPQTEEEKAAAVETPTEQPELKVNKNQPLTENLKQELGAEGKPEIPLPKMEGTWVEKLSTTNPLGLVGSGDKKTDAAAKTSGGADSLESLVQEARQPAGRNGKSNASVFDISGVMLRMNVAQVDETMQNRGFRKMVEKFQIPNFIKWRNEEGCRTSGVVGYERLDACVAEKSKKDKQQYVQLTKYTKFDTKEEMTVNFTSNYTDNRVYRIEYKSGAANITGNSPKATYLRNIKVYDFWKKINQKYGQPDNKQDVTWGMGGNKPFLKAKTGFLILEDPMFRELDYTRMSREDQRYMNTDLYSF